VTPTLLGVPFDAASSFLRGAAAGPAAIRAALLSPSSNLWTESLRDLGVPGALEDAGDVTLRPNDGRGSIERAVDQLAARRRCIIALGGDHSVSYPLIRATARARGPFTVLHLDAHPDLYPEFEGDPYSHACPFARVVEEGLAERLVQVGIRTMNGAQQAQAERHDVEVIDMRAWTAGRRPDVRGPLYLSIDLDAFDPAFAPGVSHREPGGLATRDAIDLIQRLPGPIVGADIVELNPSRDPIGITAPLAAKLVKELAARMLDDPA
jgi:agmatinase